MWLIITYSLTFCASVISLTYYLYLHQRFFFKQLENHFQLHEQQRLLPQPAEHNQYTSFPPRNHRSPGTVRARAGDRGQYSQVFERAPASPRAATLGRPKRSALADGNFLNCALTFNSGGDYELQYILLRPMRNTRYYVTSMKRQHVAFHLRSRHNFIKYVWTHNFKDGENTIENLEPKLLNCFALFSMLSCP